MFVPFFVSLFHSLLLFFYPSGSRTPVTQLMLLASRRVPCNHVPLLFPLVLTFCCLSSPLLSVANLEAPSSTLLGAPQRRQPGSSIVNASWRHDSTSQFSSASTAVPSSFRSLLQTFAFRWPSIVCDPMAHHKFFPNPTKPKSPSTVLSALAALFSQPLGQTLANLLNASVAISDFHATNPNKPRSP